MNADLAIVAGGISTVIFAVSVMPMILKAVRTQDLASYSLTNLLMTNTGNLVHSVYVYSLPAGPIWVLHAFYLVSTALMLAMYLRHAHGRTDRDLSTSIPHPPRSDHDHRPERSAAGRHA